VIPVEEEEEGDEGRDNEMQGMEMRGEEDDGGEGADLRLLQFFGFRALGNVFPGGNWGVGLVEIGVEEGNGANIICWSTGLRQYQRM
jgi:hypothetical protein